jgi:hypothetical protein
LGTLDLAASHAVHQFGSAVIFRISARNISMAKSSIVLSKQGLHILVKDILKHGAFEAVMKHHHPHVCTDPHTRSTSSFTIIPAG